MTTLFIQESSEDKIFLTGFLPGRRYPVFINSLSHEIKEIEWNKNAVFPFNPKQISKVKNRKTRKACYQSFALYKKSFKPRPMPKLKIIRNKWPRADGFADAMVYALKSLGETMRKTWERNWVCTWDLAKGDSWNAP